MQCFDSITIVDVFITIVKRLGNTFTQSVYISCSTVKICAPASERKTVQLIFFYVENCVTASEHIFLRKNVQLLLRIMSN